MEHTQHNIHIASLILLVVSVDTTSLQDGHVVMADI